MNKSYETERGLLELFGDDPEKADHDVFGRVTFPNRRGFLKGAAAMSALVGAEIVFGQFMPEGLIPEALAAKDKPIPGKHKGLTILNDRPLNAETPPHLLNDLITPASRLFVRNNGIPPKNTSASDWTITVHGEVAKNKKTYSIRDLKKKFPVVTQQIFLECGGNGRAFYNPPASGNQWTWGAVGCPEWTGVRLIDVLKDVGAKFQDAVSVAYIGKDTHVSGDPKKKPISRSIPMVKAMDDTTMIVWALNGKSLPLNNGAPVRMLVGGYPGSTSGKWLEQILMRDILHDGKKMRGKGYRLPCFPVEAGAKVATDDMCILEQMPVKSLITSVKSGTKHPQHKGLKISGHAWTGGERVAAMHLSIDFGQTWQQVSLTDPVNRFSWQHFSARIKFPKRGYYEVWARATDSAGKMQPAVTPGWNPKGYANNMVHRVAVTAV